MSDILVDTDRRILHTRYWTRMRRRRLGLEYALDCLIGKNGAVAATAKREGDGATPRGRWPIRMVMMRPDRVAAPRALHIPWRWLRPDDGWSDDPADPSYNRPVRHPHRYSAERLWRDDGAYDIIVALAYNDAPPVPGVGSAIFLHCTADRDFTEGCVAIAKDNLTAMLPSLLPGDTVNIR